MPFNMLSFLSRACVFSRYRRCLSISCYVFRNNVQLQPPSVKAQELSESIRNNLQIQPPSVKAREMSESMCVDLNTMNKLWSKNLGQNGLSQFLYHKFSNETNCFAYALDLFSCSLNEDVCKHPELRFEIMLSFSNWLMQNNVAHEQLTLELKTQAIETSLSQRDYCVMQLICDVYKLSEHKEYLKTVIERYIAEQDASKACYSVVLLGLQKEYPLEKIAIPLVFERKNGLVVKYLNAYPDLQLEMVKKLDHMVSELRSDAVLKYDNRRISPITFCKSITKIAKIYKIPSQFWPNVQRMKVYGALNFLIRKRLESPFPEKSLDEKLLNICTEPELQKALLCKLVSINDMKSAFMFANKLGVPRENWPLALLHVNPDDCSDDFQISNEPDRKGDDDSEQVCHYLSLDLEQSDVKFIQTLPEFQNCLSNILQGHDVVGIDSEWKPVAKSYRLSLLQIAIPDKVYILDLLALESCLQTHHWDMLMEGLFANPNIIKLGCGIMQDVQMLIDDYKGTTGKSVKFSHMLDLPLLYERLKILYEEDKFNNDDVPGTKGLSRLCAIILGKPLNKAIRFCNWEERPLTEAQITYAALDAYCLLQMYEKMKIVAAEKETNFQHFVNVALVITTGIAKSVKPNKAWKLVSHNQSFSFESMVFVKNFKIAVDPSLKELGLQLRMFGADVLMLDDAYNENESILDKVHKEDRVFIVGQESYEKVKPLLPEGRVHVVEEDEVENENTAAQIFKQFNIQITFNSMFSRCMTCNSNHLVNIPSSDLKEIWEDVTNEHINKHDEEHDFLEVFVEDNSESMQMTECNEVFIKPNGILSNGVKIQFDKLNENVLAKADLFKICISCGNIQSQT